MRKVLHCTKVFKNGTVKDWTINTKTGEIIKENKKEAEKMAEFMNRISPKTKKAP